MFGKSVSSDDLIFSLLFATHEFQHPLGMHQSHAAKLHTGLKHYQFQGYDVQCLFAGAVNKKG